MVGKVLIADDSPTVQKKASGILVGEGMEVVTVSNGVAAIKKLSAFNPMVILADVAMPGKDGYEVCEFVKASKEYTNVPVLLVFSDSESYDEQRGARAHADGRIRKPFDRDELISIVSRHLAAAEAAAANVQASSVAKAPPPPPSKFVLEPVDAAPEISTREQSPDLSSVEGGMAFAEFTQEEIPAVPIEPARADESAATPQPPAVEPSSPAEPVFIEEHATPKHTHEHGHEHEHPHITERTAMFRTPPEIAQPILSDELELPPVVEPTSVEPPVEAMGTAPPPVEAPPVLDSSQVYSIVYMVVAKMSPHLSPQAIEGIAQPIADEINAELSAGHLKNS